MFEGIVSGKTRVLDLAYAINDRLVPWPGDERWFEARVQCQRRARRVLHAQLLDARALRDASGRSGSFSSGENLLSTRSPYDIFSGWPWFWMFERTPSPMRITDFTRTRIDDWEKRQGQIPEGAIVLLRTGWSSRWPDAATYRNEDAAGRMHFPGFAVEAVERLIERNISGIGCDTMSVDYGASEDFAVHHLALGAGLYHLENLSDLSELPEKGAFLVVAPIKLEGGSGGPVRVFALLP